MKLTIRIILYILTFILFLLILLQVALVLILPLEKVQNKITTTIEKNLNASVKINKISASFFDLYLDKVDISTTEGKLLHIETAQIYFSPLDLLKGKIKILNINLDTVEINTVRDEKGNFNFQQLFNKAVSQPETLSKKKQKDHDDIINLLLCKTHIQNGTINYVDHKNNLILNISQISFYIEKFSFNQTFKLNGSIKIDMRLNTKQFDTAYLAFNTFANLNSMKFNKANLKIDNLVMKFKNTVFLFKGTVENFTAPAVNLNVKIKNLSSDTLINITELPEFLISEIDIATKVVANIDKNNIVVESLEVKTIDSLINASGNFDYNNDKLIYNFKVYFDIFISKLSDVLEMFKKYEPSGNIKGELIITDKNLINGNFSLIDMSLVADNMGYFTNINSKVEVKNIDNIKIPRLTGKLNNHPFLAEVSYLTKKNHQNISILFRAQKIFGKTIKKNIHAPVIPKSEKQIAEVKKKSTSFPHLNVQIDFMADEIDAPFFAGKDIIFKTDLSGVTSDLKKIKGNLYFQSGKGTIKDLYKLTNSNALMKGLFLSVDIVSRVINALNVLDILNSIGTAVFTSNPETAKNVDGQPEQKQKLDGKMDFDSFITSLNLKDGKGTFKKCEFISSILSFKITGEMNFQKDKLNMKVNTAPGRHKDDGIMPLTIKITGTIEKPTGSLSVLGSVYSLVTQSILNNVVSDGFKKGFMSLLGLNKHDEKGNEIQDVNISTDTLTPDYKPPETLKQ